MTPRLKEIYSKEIQPALKNQFGFKNTYMGPKIEKVVLNKYPELKRIKSYLSGLSNALFVRMSGSGSSIVAYFHSKKACKKAYSQYKRKFTRHWCIESKTI